MAATKKPKGRRAGGRARPKKAAAGRASGRRLIAGARPIDLQEWLATIAGMHAATAADAASDERGACLVKDPRTGQTFCIRTSPDACKALKGTFVGGPCGN